MTLLNASLLEWNFYFEKLQKELFRIKNRNNIDHLTNKACFITYKAH